MSPEEKFRTHLKLALEHVNGAILETFKHPQRVRLTPHEREVLADIQMKLEVLDPQF